MKIIYQLTGHRPETLDDQLDVTDIHGGLPQPTVSILAEITTRGYRWTDGSDGRLKCWQIEVGEENWPTNFII